MISESKDKKPVFDRSRGKILFRYNFEEISFEDSEGNEDKKWRFTQVLIQHPIDRSKLIDAVISEKYDKSAEIALINNKNLSQEGSADYDEYQAFRAQAKQIVDEAL